MARHCPITANWQIMIVKLLTVVMVITINLCLHLHFKFDYLKDWWGCWLIWKSQKYTETAATVIDGAFVKRPADIRCLLRKWCSDCSYRSSAPVALGILWSQKMRLWEERHRWKCPDKIVLRIQLRSDHKVSITRHLLFVQIDHCCWER